MTDDKSRIIAALRSFVAQRPGLEFGNYGDIKAYRAELRTITQRRADAERLLDACALDDLVTADLLVRAAQSAYSGRLVINASGGRVAIDYIVGQYWPTEYRAAVCAVCAAALWESERARMPAARGRITRTHGPFTTEHDDIEGLTPGDWLRRAFRRRFGVAIARRWFN